MSVTLKTLTKWHLDRAAEANHRAMTADTNSCRTANQRAVEFHSDAAELLSDLLYVNASAARVDGG
jgi:hypothetical protein